MGRKDVNASNLRDRRELLQGRFQFVGAPPKRVRWDQANSHYLLALVADQTRFILPWEEYFCRIHSGHV
jgi:hypothetical protein